MRRTLEIGGVLVEERTQLGQHFFYRTSKVSLNGFTYRSRKICSRGSHKESKGGSQNGAPLSFNTKALVEEKD